MTVLRKPPSGILPSPLSLLPPPSSASPSPPLKLDYFRAYNALVQHPSLPQESPGASEASLTSGRVVRTRVEVGKSTWVSLLGHKQLSGRIETHTRI